jgi:hypothetical protein
VGFEDLDLADLRVHIRACRGGDEGVALIDRDRLAVLAVSLEPVGGQPSEDAVGEDETHERECLVRFFGDDADAVADIDRRAVLGAGASGPDRDGLR